MDGGDISCVEFTSEKLNHTIRDKTCICHLLNNVIKRILGDFFEEHYLIDWRRFIKRIQQSNPMAELWTQCCIQYVLFLSLTFLNNNILRVLGKEIILQRDTETRWSSTVAMLAKANSVKLAVERLYNLTNLEHKDQHVCNFCCHNYFFIFSESVEQLL